MADSGSASFIEAARRAQITEAAITTVTEAGYHGASLAQIAARAGTSKSVISYHFGSKEQMLRSVVEHVFARFDAVLSAAVENVPSARAQLTSYIDAYLEFVRHHRDEVLAAMEISVSHRDSDGVPLYLVNSAEDTALVTSIVSEGVAAGEFRDTDLTVTATTIIHALDGAVTHSYSNPDTNLVIYGEHLKEFLLAALVRGTHE